MEDTSSRGRTEELKVHLLGSCRKRRQWEKKKKTELLCRCGSLCLFKFCREAGKARIRPGSVAKGYRLGGTDWTGPSRAGGGERGGPSPGVVNFSWAAACQPQKALKVQQPAPASAAAFVRVIYDFNLGSPRVHTAFAAVEG